MTRGRGSNAVAALKKLGWKRSGSSTLTSLVHETGARAFMDASGAWVAVRVDGTRNGGLAERSRALAWATGAAA